MIGIVGGGLSGLFVLDLLAERGEEAVLFEATEIPGGVVQSRVVKGPDGPVTVDLGPQRVRLSPGLAALVDRIGLTNSLLRARPGVPFTVHHEGRLHFAPLNVRDALRTPLVSPVAKIRALADLVTSAPRPSETVAEAFRRKLGPDIHIRLAGPILGGLYGSDPAQMESRHTLLPVLSRSGGGRSLLRALMRASRGTDVAVVSFREGMGALALALVQRHAHRVRLGSPISAIEGVPGGGFRLRAQSEVVPVDQVVLTLPAPQAGPLLRRLSSDASDRIGSLRYNPLVVVPLVVPRGLSPPDVGSGFKETLESRALTRGVTAHGALFDRRGLYSAFLGGMGREDELERPDAELMELAAREFRSVTGVRPVPLLVHRTWMPAWDRSWSALDGLALPEGIHLCSAWTHRPGIPGRLEDAQRVTEQLRPSG